MSLANTFNEHLNTLLIRFLSNNDVRFISKSVLVIVRLHVVMQLQNFSRLISVNCTFLNDHLHRTNPTQWRRQHNEVFCPNVGEFYSTLFKTSKNKLTSSISNQNKSIIQYSSLFVQKKSERVSHLQSFFVLFLFRLFLFVREANVCFYVALDDL